MIKPQEIQEKEFPKAVFGGYDMQSVDDFLESLVGDYNALYKEGAVLKSKLKVLAEKIEEYRNTEDSMRMTFLTAQKMGNELIDKAKAEAETTREEARKQAQEYANEVAKKIRAEERRLNEIRKNTSELTKRILHLYEGQVEFIREASELVIPRRLEGALKDMPDRGEPEAEQPQSKAAGKVAGREAVRKPEALPEDEKRRQNEEKPQAVNVTDEIARNISDSLGDTSQFNPDDDKLWDDEGEPTTTRPKFNFEDLQFGKNLEEEQ